jgi:hypothetical protein
MKKDTEILDAGTVVTDKDKFKCRLNNTIKAKFSELMQARPDSTAKGINYIEAQTLTTCVRNIFINRLGIVPPQVETACLMSEAVVAPDKISQMELIKAAIGIGGGAAGIGIVIAAIGTALGWGAGVIASVTAFFVGTAIGGPVLWAVAGVIIAGIASYYAFLGSNAELTQRFLNTLEKSTQSAVDVIWPEYGEKLSDK